MIVYLWIQDIYLKQIEKNLLQNIDTLSLELKNKNRLNNLAKRYKKKVGIRLTVINRHGIVLAESDNDFKTMENHSSREEIIQAKYDGIGSSTRHSDTLDKMFLYVAKKVTIDNEIIYIRMADDLEVIESEFTKLAMQITAIFFIIVVIAVIIAYGISVKIKKETDNILYSLQRLTNNEAVKAEISTYTQEFSKITKHIQTVAAILAKRNKQKAKQTAKLRASNKQKDEIISAISHEFKNPIAVITGYSETILNDDGINKDIQKKFLQKIFSSANRMSTIIDRLRLSIKLEEGKQDSTFNDLNIKSLCNDIIEDLKLNYKDREIILNGEETIVNADETLMSIAISNLIENALKYSEDDVSVIIKKSSLEVKDKGMGIAKKDLSKITNKFYRTSKNGWDNSLGLGLSIVHNILDIHKFKLEIKSRLDIGSTFSIHFK